MNTAITFTLSQMIAWVLAVCAGVACIATAINWIVKAWHAARAPNEKQDERLKKLEGLCTRYERAQEAEDKRLDKLEEGNRVTQRALLALLAHGIDGNEVGEMKAAKEELQAYLIEK